MKKTFSVQITLDDGVVHTRQVSATGPLELFDRMQAIAKEFPNYVRSEGRLVKEPS